MEGSQKNAEIFSCEPCQFTCVKLSEWSRHIATRKHSAKGPEKRQEYVCTKCNITCCKLSKWSRHILTAKHLNDNKTPMSEKRFACRKCKKEYKSQSSVKYHESKCTHVETQYVSIIDRLINENAELRNLIVVQTKTVSETMNKTIETIMVQNNESMNKIIETCKPVNNTINQTNNKFNINVFLNETCKNAMNFSDFVNNIQISYEDLENNAKLGFVNGISKIFLDNLNQLDISERPIHCTDVKRETMYIRDDNTWKKQTDDQILQKAIQAVSYKSMGKLAKWKEENPDYKDADSEFSQRCLTIQKHTLAGSERGVYYPKVIHALARETVVEKT
jgi:hypothetical protein